jgi:FHA domain
MKLGKLCLVFDEENSIRIKKALEIEKPEIPDFIVINKEPIWLGIAPCEKDSIIIRHGQAGISRKHSLIHWEKHERGKDQWYITDCSSNGTIVNDKRIPRDLKTELNQGDVIVFGDPTISALRYRFILAAEDTPLKRALDCSANSSVKKKKTNLSASTSTTGSAGNVSETEIHELFNALHAMDNELVGSKEEFLCIQCRKVCFFPIFFKCYHNICFLCYYTKIYNQSSQCPKCNRNIYKNHYPYRNYLLMEAIEKKLDKEALDGVMILDRIITRIEKKIQHEIRGRSHAKNIMEMESQLPIYSYIWSPDHESQFRDSFSQMTKEEKVENLIAKGLSMEFIKKADEEEIDLVMNRLEIFDPVLSLEEKKNILENLIRF